MTAKNIVPKKDKEKSDSSPPLMPTTSVGTEPTGFGKLARRISGITSNCLFTAIVLVAALGIGRQIMHWWAADEPRQSAPQNADVFRELSDADQLHILQFGGQNWSLARREVHGSREQAEKQLQLDCRQQIAQVKNSPEKQISKHKNLLASLAKTSPLNAELPHWQLFALGKNKLIVVGVKPPLAKNAEEKSEIAGSQVVLWGIALPKGKNEWSELLFIPSEGGEPAIPLLAEIPLPPKCRKMLSVQAVNGSAMVSFSGPGNSEDWREHFEKEFAKEGWKAVFPWKYTGSAWYAQYSGQNQGKNRTADVHFYPDKEGMAGLLIVGEEN